MDLVVMDYSTSAIHFYRNKLKEGYTDEDVWKFLDEKGFNEDEIYWMSGNIKMFSE